jgi:hypothetical protein
VLILPKSKKKSKLGIKNAYFHADFKSFEKVIKMHKRSVTKLRRKYALSTFAQVRQTGLHITFLVSFKTFLLDLN